MEIQETIFIVNAIVTALAGVNLHYSFYIKGQKKHARASAMLCFIATLLSIYQAIVVE